MTWGREAKFEATTWVRAKDSNLQGISTQRWHHTEGWQHTQCTLALQGSKSSDRVWVHGLSRFRAFKLMAAVCGCV